MIGYKDVGGGLWGVVNYMLYGYYIYLKFVWGVGVGGWWEMIAIAIVLGGGRGGMVGNGGKHYKQTVSRQTV